jgi:2-oxoglutarate ferredoxin oxidoreductase subunit alpha
MQKIDENVDDIIMFEERNVLDADTIMICYGGTTRSVRSAMDTARARGQKVGLFRPITIWPFPEKEIKKICKDAKRVLVVEHNYGQLKLEVERCVAGACKVDFLGKVDGSVITPDEILVALEEK